MKVNCKYKKLGDIGTVITGATPSTSNADYYKYQDFPFFKPGDIQEHGITILDSSETYVSKEAYNQSRKLPQGSVLTTCIGTIGKVGIIQQDSICNQQINAIIPHNEIGSQYLAYAILSIRDILRAKKNGPVVPIINKTSFSSFRIPVPALTIQQRIVAELDRIQGLIDRHKAQIADLDTLAQSIFLDTFGDPVTNPKGWKTPAMNSCLNEMFIGPFGSALKKEIFVEKDEAYCMMYEQKHAIKKTLDFTPHYLAENTYNELSRFEVFPGDIIVSCRGTIGEMYVLPDNAPKGIIHSSLMKIRINKRVNLTYFLFALNAIFKNQRTKGACIQMAIKATDLKKMLFPLPPISLQELFATRVKTIEALKEKLREQVADCELLMAERMQYYFS